MSNHASFCIAVALLACFHGHALQAAATNTATRAATAVIPRSKSVGMLGKNVYANPHGQLLTPAGRQVELPGMRPQALALSPDGRLLVTSGRTNLLIVIDPANGRILQQVPLPSSRMEAPAADDQDTDTTDKSSTSTNTIAASSSSILSLTGLTFSPDGKRIFLSNVGGSVKVFAVDEQHRVRPFASLPLPDVLFTNTPATNSSAGSDAPRRPGFSSGTRRRVEIPAGLAVSRDNARLYVVASLGHKLYELDALTGKVLRALPTGVAPFDVVLHNGKAYVSNQGGREPATNNLTAPTGRGGPVRVDPVRHIACEGSVSVFDLASGALKKEILVELHASAMALSPDGRHLVVANTGSDTLSVIDTTTDTVVEKIWARQTPADLFGAQPNALAFDPAGRRLYVCNGTQNAVAVIAFEPAEKKSALLGLIPVGWFPGAVVVSPNGKNLAVANIRGHGAIRTLPPGETNKLTSRNFYGTVSLVPAPSKTTLKTMTRTALRNMRYPKLQEAALPPRPGQPPRPVPERVGEPSVFKHVIYVIKENRTYDQVLGDMPEGKGHPGLCTFGEKYTPNQHKIAREFVLLDNTYCSGIQSADGHQWTDSGIANAYIERQASSGFPRSYPGAKEADSPDALAWASSGFIWDNALAHGKTFRNYGEWMISEAGWKDKSRRTPPSWRDFWNDYAHGSNQTRLACRPGIETLRAHSKLDTVGWDLKVTDQMRAQAFIQELKEFETKGGFPNLILIFLPNDHTGGTRGRYPTPGAQVADNDLAFGKIVEAVSHSKFWPETCLIAIEDDPQNGWDHVSGYRTTCYVVSPYTKRRQTISTHYSQTSILRTIELILGLPPMNQLDATATPMHDCFVNHIDLTPFTSVPNRVPLDDLNPPARSLSNRLLRQGALLSERLPLHAPDLCPEGALNRILWHAMKGPDAPFPEWAIKLVDDD